MSLQNEQTFQNFFKKVEFYLSLLGQLPGYTVLTKKRVLWQRNIWFRVIHIFTYKVTNHWTKDISESWRSYLRFLAYAGLCDINLKGIRKFLFFFFFFYLFYLLFGMLLFGYFL